MTIDRLDQSRRLTAAVRALDLCVPAGMAYRHSCGLAVRALGGEVVSGALINLRDPLTRAGVPLLVAQAAGVEVVFTEPFYDGTNDVYCWNVCVGYSASEMFISGHIERTDFSHADRTEAYLLFLEDLVDQAATTAPTHRLECGLCGSDWLDVPADKVEAARKAQTECLECHKPMAPETWTVYPLVSTATTGGQG